MIEKVNTSNVLSLTDMSTTLGESLLSGLSETENQTASIYQPTFQPNYTETSISLVTDHSTTKAPDLDVLEDNNFNFIIIPFAVLLGIIGLSALVYLMARNRRRLAHIYCKRNYERKYTFEEDSHTVLEQDDGYDFDDPTECLLKGKLQIDNSYESTGRKDLYT